VTRPTLRREWRIANWIIWTIFLVGALVSPQTHQNIAVIFLLLAFIAAICTASHFYRLADLYQSRADQLEALRTLEQKIQQMNGSIYQRPPFNPENIRLAQKAPWRH
jgi:hypothetical protein